MPDRVPLLIRKANMPPDLLTATAEAMAVTNDMENDPAPRIHYLEGQLIYS